MQSLKELLKSWTSFVSLLIISPDLCLSKNETSKRIIDENNLFFIRVAVFSPTIAREET
jgi:hypothetical protein